MAKKKRITKELADNLLDDIASLKKVDLKTLINECQELTQTNCWWIEYHLKDAIKLIAENELENRP